MLFEELRQVAAVELVDERLLRDRERDVDGAELFLRVLVPRV
jgi:hypothetical protein